jgi:hypothetical protein
MACYGGLSLRNVLGLYFKRILFLHWVDIAARAPRSSSLKGHAKPVRNNSSASKGFPGHVCAVALE